MEFAGDQARARGIVVRGGQPPLALAALRIGLVDRVVPDLVVEGRIPPARIVAPLAIGELDIADTSSSIGTSSASGRLAIPIATGVLT